MVLIHKTNLSMRLFILMSLFYRESEKTEKQSPK